MLFSHPPSALQNFAIMILRPLYRPLLRHYVSMGQPTQTPPRTSSRLRMLATDPEIYPLIFIVMLASAYGGYALGKNAVDKALPRAIAAKTGGYIGPEEGVEKVLKSDAGKIV